MQSVRILNDLPVNVDMQAVLRQLQIRPDSPAVPHVQALIERVRACARPRALYRSCRVGKLQNDRVWIDGVQFTSRTLANLLRPVDRVYVYVVTGGRELETAVRPGGKTIEKLALDVVGNVILRSSSEALEEHLAQHVQLEKIGRIGPGAGDGLLWPVDQQASLFELLGDTKAAIGVELTADCMMLPMKSLSGLLFETQTDFCDCQLCRSEGCSVRVAPFDQALRDDLAGPLATETA